jgi:ATP-binding cassette subfamily F protein 3
LVFLLTGRRRHGRLERLSQQACDGTEVDMLTVHQLAKSFALNSLFTDVTFNINPGDRAGLIGPNGCGKTTLLRILAGKETADTGHLARVPGLRIGYLSQGFELENNASVSDVVGRVAGNIAVLEAELVEISQALARQPGDQSLQSQYDAVLQRISAAETGRAARILAGLGLDRVPAEFPVGRLSGGQKTRLNLALVLLNNPQLLLLDEPTNHLDIGMLEWLEEWLAGFSGAALLVSHDRTFLDRTVTRILAMDPLERKVTEYPGNYRDYVEQVRRDRDKQWAAFKDQQQEIRRLKQDNARVKAQAAHTERQASSVRIGGEKMK